MTLQETEAAFLADQILFLIFFGAFLVLNVVQLLVARKAKYDQRQVHANLRIREWKTIQNKLLSRNHNLLPEHGLVTVDMKQSNKTSSNRRSRSVGSSVRGNRVTVKVGPLQWALHRIGVIICILELWIHIDPYVIHHILPRTQVNFLSLNGSALCFIAAIVSFYYPIHLINVFALNQRNKTFEKIAIVVSMFIVFISNLFPAVYALYAPKNFLRAILYTLYFVALAFICIVFNVSMKKLESSVRTLIDYHRSMSRTRKVSSAYVRDTNSPTPPAIVTPASVVTYHDELPSPQPPTTDRNSIEYAVFFPENTISSATTEQRGSTSVPPTPALRQVSCSSVTTESAANEANDVNEVSSAASIVVASNQDHSQSLATGSVSHSSASLLTDGYDGSSSSHLQTPVSAQVVELQCVAVTRTSASPSVSRLPISPSNQTTELSTGPKAIPQAVKEYEQMLTKLKRFQKYSTLIVILALVALGVTIQGSVRDPDGDSPIVESGSYASAVPQLPLYLSHAAAVAVFYWYAYIPMSVLCQK